MFRKITDIALSSTLVILKGSSKLKLFGLVRRNLSVVCDLLAFLSFMHYIFVNSREISVTLKRVYLLFKWIYRGVIALYVVF